jgi:hypothetical protein
MDHLHKGLWSQIFESVFRLRKRKENEGAESLPLAWANAAKLHSADRMCQTYLLLLHEAAGGNTLVPAEVSLTAGQSVEAIRETIAQAFPDLAWNTAKRHPGTSNQYLLPFQNVESEQTANALIEANRQIRSLQEENETLKSANRRLKSTQDDMLLRLNRYTEALRAFEMAEALNKKGHHLFTEYFTGRVETVTVDSLDVVYEDATGSRFNQNYDLSQFRGAKIPDRGDFIFALGSLFRKPTVPPTQGDILNMKTTLEDIELSGEDLTELEL